VFEPAAGRAGHAVERSGTDRYVTTRAHDAQRSSVDPDQTPFTSVGLHWQQPVDGAVFAQPLANTETTSSGALCSNLGPSLGITSTPVLDTATGRLYVVAQLATRSVHFEPVGLDANTGAVVFGAGHAIVRGSSVEWVTTPPPRAA
jgi:hypothetical protein